MNRRLWSCVITAALILGTVTGCNENNGSLPAVNTENPALASITNSSKDPTNSSSSSASSSALETKVDPVLRDTLDGYETFFKEYTEYIDNYKASDSAMLQAYAAQSEEISKKLENFDTGGLNAKEESYLSDVKYRINKMLDSVKDKLPEWNAEKGEYEMPFTDKMPSTSREPAFSMPPLPEMPELPEVPEMPDLPDSSSSKPNSSSKPGSSSKPNSSSKPDSSKTPVSSEKPAESSSTLLEKPVGSEETTESTQSELYSLPEIIDVSAPDTSSLITDYTRKWAYNQLSSPQKEAYARLYESAVNYIENINISDLKLSQSDIDTVYWAFDYDNPQFLTLGSGYTYSYTNSGEVVQMGIDYGRSPENVPSDFESVAQSVINDAQQMGSDYERLKYVHDWIVNNTSYISSGPVSKSEADGPVIYGQALCEGYSKAFMYFAQSMSYECVCVSGYSNGNHMWNMVKVGGNWYHVDATWDDPLSNSGPVLRHNYFLVSDSTISSDHTIDNYFPVPSAPYDYQ